MLWKNVREAAEGVWPTDGGRASTRWPLRSPTVHHSPQPPALIMRPNASALISESEDALVRKCRAARHLPRVEAFHQISLALRLVGARREAS